MRTPNHLYLKMDPDERLAAGAGGAVRCLADAAGLPDEAILQFQASVVSACKRCFGAQSPDKFCEIMLDRLQDRIQVEVTVSECKSPQEKDKLAWPGVDEVRCEPRDDSTVLRLTKFLSSDNSRWPNVP